MRANPWITRSLLTCGLLLAVLGPGCPPARAGNITYNFNETNGSEQGWYPSLSGTVPDWYWNLESSNKGGGWQTFTGTIGPNYGAYLTSPCMVISNQDQQWVNVKISHRYNFPLTGTTGIANQLGQVQFRIDSGSGWGGWQGVPKQYFVNFNGNPVPNSYPPNYGPPGQTLFSPLITTAGTSAWSETTLGFDTKDHQPSEFTLFFNDFGLANGNEIEFRFLMATDQPVSGTSALVWEVNSVKIDGVEPCVVPEPGALALAAIGVAGLLVVRSRRRAAWRKLGDSAAVAVVIAAVAVGCVLAARPAEADVLFDFKLTSGTWTKSIVGDFVPATKQWEYKTASPKRWSVLASGVDNYLAATGNLLTSPSFSGLTGSPAAPAVNARISIAHNFWLPAAAGGGPIPIAAGQIQYRLNGTGDWLALPAVAYTSGGSVNDPDLVFPPSPFANPLDPLDPFYVDQTAFVPPTYVPPTGPASSIPPLVNGGASFVGQSPGFASQYVPSQAFLNVDTGLVGSISSLQLRLVQANLGASCPDGAGWNVRMVAVDFASTIDPVPEPTSIALAACGGGLAVTAGVLRRRRSPAALEAE